MLRITRTTDGNAVTFKLEGKLLAAWREEVRRSCAQVPAGRWRKRLDLSELLFADAAGVAVLRELSQAGFEITDCSRFIAELVQMEEI